MAANFIIEGCMWQVVHRCTRESSSLHSKKMFWFGVADFLWVTS